MREYFMAGAAAIAMAMVPGVGLAQADVPGSTNAVGDKRSDQVMTAEQQTVYDAWPAERRADFDAWPNEHQVYFWSLDPEQQEAFWVLTPEQRTQIAAMSPEQQVRAWNSVMAQLGQGPATAARSSGTQPGQAPDTQAAQAPDAPAAQASASAAAPSAAAPRGDTRFVTNEVVQGNMTPADRPSEYPVCRGNVQDSCINPRAAGMNWGNRPLDYWPGKPASEGG